MMQRYSLIHRTLYEYDYEATESYTRVKITPIETFCQSVHSHTIEVLPDVTLYKHDDYFGNAVVEFSAPFRHRHLEIIARSEVTLYEPSKEPLSSKMKIKEAVDWFREYELEFYDFLKPSPFVYTTDEVKKFAEKHLPDEGILTECLLELNQCFTKDFKYRSGSTNINTPLDEVLKNRKGVCQDYAHLMIAALRAKGIAARYVSGYIESYVPGQSELVGSEQSHAWLDVYIPDFSWFGLDPTNNKFSSSQHLRVAVGRDFHDVSPVRGTFKGYGRQNLTVEVKMRRVDNKPSDSASGFQKIA
ncbi:MAG TPA: transglutaminase family protein [Leptospiraceae bacterium]|nr:transglutaminase family protein [Leptospiraceae bacterium]HMY68873.1 transglutaminase family protein [Leptospiraceae bacterium]HMZ59523.1 transglutaminase family protein [Leptospiraceae bacterium]HNF13800.1 transglutaminase family protein [Leptospiraceae bacterium]HNF26207.1 transglutaminase family protein [Leptospiraceae bacterium]